MKTPDTIYVHTGAHLGQLTLTTIPVGGPEEQRYIRKDALVQRINKQILFYQNSVSVNDYEEGCNKGAIAALEHIVKSL